jgi:HEAT repeat protein
MRSLALVVVLGLAAAACENATSDRIQTWKGTEKGPEKIEAALRSANVPASLRAEAAAALVDIGRPEKVDEIMDGIPAGERWEILKTLMELYIKGMSSPQLPKVRDARDGLFSMRAYAPPEEQKRIDGVLLASIEKDLVDGRFSGGRHSADKMLSAIGTPSGPMLVRLLGNPKAPYRGLAELLVKVGDGAMRDKGGTALIGRMTPGKVVPNDMWLSLGMLGGPAVTAFLSDRMQKGAPEDSIAAAKALQQSRFPTVLPIALKIAADPKANKELRGEAFGVIEKIGGHEAQTGLLRIIAEDKNDIVRYRAHEAALEVGKADAIVPALEAFPAKLSFKREDVVDFLVKDISKLGLKAKAQVVAALASPSPLARMSAVLALEAPVSAAQNGHMGGTDEAAALLKLAQDKATIKGFPVGMTVGAEARRVAALLGNKGK